MKTIKLDLRTMKGKIYFMSDLHYNHNNILTMNDKRDQFEDITEMNKYIIEELRTKLTPDDILFDLGDLGWRLDVKNYLYLLDSIPTKNIYKIMGNHDSYELYYGKSSPIPGRFKQVEQYLNLHIWLEDKDAVQISLFHFPIEDFDHMFHGGLHLFGHVHGSLDKKYAKGGDPKLMADVGFDSALARKAGSFLIPLETILEHFRDKTEGGSFLHWARNNYKYE